MFRWFCVTLSIAALGCGSKAVDLDGNGEEIEPGSEPSVLGTVHQNLAQIRVDDQRVYWLAAGPREYPDLSRLWALRGCEKANCASSLVTFSTQRAVQISNEFGVVAGEVYWFQLADERVGLPMDGKTYLVASPAAGGGVPRIVSDSASSVAAHFSDDAVYISGPSQTDSLSTEIDAIALPDGGERRRVATLGQQSVLTLQTQGDYVYWIYGDPQSTCAIERTRTDGTSAVETLAAAVEINALQDEDLLGPRAGLAVDSDHFYWTEHTLAGSLDRCPLAGCAGSVETLLTPIRSPSDVLLDGSNAYLLHEVDAYSYAVSRCALDHCLPSAPLVTGVDGTNLLAVDDQYLYTATTMQDLGGPSEPASPRVQIRRFAK
jgi:hypothetical protein